MKVTTGQWARVAGYPRHRVLRALRRIKPNGERMAGFRLIDPVTDSGPLHAELARRASGIRRGPK